MAFGLQAMLSLFLLSSSLAFIDQNFKIELNKSTRPPSTVTTRATTPKLVTTKATAHEGVKTKEPQATPARPQGFEAQRGNIPPHILEKLRQVNGISDFIRVFNIKGVKVEKSEPVAPKPEEVSKNVYMVDLQEGGQMTRMSVGGDATQCQPRPVVEALPQPTDLASFYYPACVSVNRCGGCCISTQHVKCMPSAVEVKRVAVFRVYFSGGNQAESLDVTEDKQCACQCSLTSEDCGPLLTYDPQSCQCVCNRKKECDTKDGLQKQWSDRHCDCICSNRITCPENRVWDEEMCQCRCTSQPCPVGWERDRNTCQCSISLSRGLQNFRCYAVNETQSTPED